MKEFKEGLCGYLESGLQKKQDSLVEVHSSPLFRDSVFTVCRTLFCTGEERALEVSILPGSPSQQGQKMRRLRYLEATLTIGAGKVHAVDDHTYQTSSGGTRVRVNQTRVPARGT